MTRSGTTVLSTSLTTMSESRRLRDQFGSDRGIVHFQLARAVNLSDTALASDGMHLNAQGNAVITALVDPGLVTASPLGHE